MKIKKSVYIIVIIIIILCIVFIDSLLPAPLEKNGPFEYSVVNGVEYMSDYYEMGPKEYAIYAFLNDNGEDGEFVVSTVEKKGLLHNKYEFCLFNPFEDTDILNPDYANLSNIPFDNYASLSGKVYGSLYAGIVPNDCRKITIDGKEAQLEHFKFDYKNHKVDFILYYCFIEDVEINEDRKIEIERA